MSYFLLHSFSVLITILQGLLLVYLFFTLIPISSGIQKILQELTMPMMQPIVFLMNRSVFGKHLTELIPVITFLVLSYLQKFITLGMDRLL